MKPILALAPLAAAVIAAGCGSGSAPTSASSGAQTRSGSAMVATAHTRLGTVLVDARGRTLYLFAKDRGSSSSCYGSCASVWPPLLTDVDPAPGAGAHAARLGSSRRRDGKRIVTYSGHPLYTYAGDSKPGDVHGQGADQFGAPWYVLAPSGAKIDDDQ
jgi:predicted lipoprotein with Yx(FWY)xxD motif